jgi:hypothetical protein
VWNYWYSFEQHVGENQDRNRLVDLHQYNQLWPTFSYFLTLLLETI